MSADFAGHTPGPWNVDPSHPRDIQADGVEVSMTFHEAMNRSLLVSGFLPLTIHEAEANARLIAAAPDLLKERDELRRQNEEQAREIERLKESLRMADDAGAGYVEREVDLKQRLAAAEAYGKTADEQLKKATICQQEFESALLAEQALRAEVSAALQMTRNALDEAGDAMCCIIGDAQHCDCNSFGRAQGWRNTWNGGLPVVQMADKALALTPGEALRKHDLKVAWNAFREACPFVGKSAEEMWEASNAKAALEKGGAE